MNRVWTAQRAAAFTRVRLARGHGHAGATFIHFADGVQVGEIQPGIDAVHVEVQCDGDNVEIARAFAVAEKRAFDAIRSRQQTQLSCRHTGVTVIVRMQTNN